MGAKNKKRKKERAEFGNIGTKSEANDAMKRLNLELWLKLI